MAGRLQFDNASALKLHDPGEPPTTSTALTADEPKDEPMITAGIFAGKGIGFNLYGIYGGGYLSCGFDPRLTGYFDMSIYATASSRGVAVAKPVNDMISLGLYGYLDDEVGLGYGFMAGVKLGTVYGIVPYFNLNFGNHRQIRHLDKNLTVEVGADFNLIPRASLQKLFFWRRRKNNKS